LGHFSDPASWPSSPQSQHLTTIFFFFPILLSSHVELKRKNCTYYNIHTWKSKVEVNNKNLNNK
jgi:hypothetical protein